MEFRVASCRTLLLTAVAITAAATASGQTSSFTVTTTPGQQTRGARLGAPEMRLSLQDAVAIALGHNIDLEISRLGLAQSGQGVLAATGIFDPYATVSLTEASSKSPATNQLVGAQVNDQKRRTFNVGFGQFLPTGANVSVGWDNTRSETNSSFYYLNPSYTAGLNLSLDQPLLRGFGTDVTRRAIEVARRNRDISTIQFEQIVIATVQQVESSYWNLVYAKENLKVKQESLKLAQDLLDQTRTRVRIGTSAPIDIIQSEATVAAREQDIIVAENAVQGAADALKQLLGFENPEDWKSEIIPVDSLGVTPVTVDLDQAIEQALKTRIELKQQELQKQIGELNLVAADNAVKPGLDLVVGYGYSGVGGTLTERDPNTGAIIRQVPGGWNDALRQITNVDYPQWSAGLNLSYTFGNNQAKAQRATSRFAVGIAEQNIAAQRQAVINATRAAVRGLADSAKAIAASEKARVLAERNLDAEQKKFANGMSTNYQVLQIQADLAVALVNELAARVSYRQAAVAYQVAVGNLLKSKGVELDVAPPPKEPHTYWKDVGWMKYGRWAKDAGTVSEPPSETKPAGPATSGTE
ncbi:MAG: TolC family protein [Acidobacteriota bacterium]